MKYPHLILVLWLLLITSEAQAMVWVFSEPNCSGYFQYFEDANVPNLSGQTYWGTNISMDNSIKSIYVDEGWELWGCKYANYQTCAKQVNHFGTETGCINFRPSCYYWCWWSPSELPLTLEMSSFVVQPNSFTSYWEYFDYKERQSDPGEGRIGYIELWDTVGFTGHNYKMYFTDTNLGSKPIGLNTRSIRTYGNIYVQLCVNSACSVVFTIKDVTVHPLLQRAG